MTVGKATLVAILALLVCPSQRLAKHGVTRMRVVADSGTSRITCDSVRCISVRLSGETWWQPERVE